MKRWAVFLLCSYLLVLCLATVSAHASRITRHDRNVIRFFHNHPKLAATPAGARALMKVLPHVVRELAAVQWPAHHQLWLCIHDHEASSWTATNGQYRGGLQLHYGWGYGSSYDASVDSQLVQEQAAERAYAASGFSRLFLEGQWLNYDGGYGCLAYA